MNKKGFTLIELLAVIVVLGLVLVVTIPTIGDSYRKSKLKSEEIFVKRLSEVIDEYIKLNSDELNNFEILGDLYTKESQAKKVTVWETTKTVEDIIDSGLLKSSDYVNAGNKNATCNIIDAIVKIYKDSDGVYCHKVEKGSLGCLTDEYKNKITGKYVINTCVWS